MKTKIEKSKKEKRLAPREIIKDEFDEIKKEHYKEELEKKKSKENSKKEK